MNKIRSRIMAALLTAAAAVIINISFFPEHTVATGAGSEGDGELLPVSSDRAAEASIGLSVSDDLQQIDIPLFPEKKVPASDILVSVFAGVGVVTERGIMPTDEELEYFIEEQANSWKKEGALVMADVNMSVNVRTEPDEGSELAGKLYKDCGGYIIEYTDEWTKLESGAVTGWVSNDYLLFGDEAKALYEEVGRLQATVTGQTLRVRKGTNTESEVLGMVTTGDVFEVTSDEDGWVAIDFEGDDGYISKEYVSLEYKIDYGETQAAIEAREKAEAEAKARAAKEKAKAKAKKKYGAYAADADDVTLLGALIQCEAGNQTYEGQLAVGAVVMNRVRSGAYPSTLYGVIYASGQFSPAGSGKVDARIAKGVKSSCLKAATEALNGVSNVGSATHFRRTGSHAGIEIGGHVFW